MFYIFNILYFVHSRDCDKSVMTVIFSILNVIGYILTVILRILTVILCILTVMRRPMTVILTAVTVWMRSCVDARETRFASSLKSL